MPVLSDNVLDSGLAYLTNIDAVHLCSQEPASYAEVATYSLASKSSPTVGAVGDRTGGGRKRTIAAITDATVSTGGTATHWAAIYSGNSELVAANALSASKVLSTSFAAAIDAIEIGIKDAVSA